MGADQGLAVSGQTCLVDVGAYRLGGRGEPTVVLEMVLGAAGDCFDAIARQVAEFTRVVWYDHAALGRSDIAPIPTLTPQYVADLHQPLRVAQFLPLYEVAGHSMARITAR